MHPQQLEDGLLKVIIAACALIILAPLYLTYLAWRHATQDDRRKGR